MQRSLWLAIAILCTSLSPAIAKVTESSKIEKLIQDSRHVTVQNESADKERGDIIVESHQTGETGQYKNHQIFVEESRRLTKNLEHIVAFDPNAASLYPGALVQGKSLPDGVLFPIYADRRPQMCTVTGVNGGRDFSYSKAVVPTQANITKTVSNILSQKLPGSQPAKMTYSATSFSSVDEAMTKLNASYHWLNGHVDGAFSTRNANAATRLMVRFVQSYYTVSCDGPTSPARVFGPRATVKELARYISKDNPPAMVVSVTYGRELWMLIESSHSEKELNASLDAAIKAGLGNANAGFDQQRRQILQDSSVQVLVVGGGGKAAVQVIGGNPDKIIDFIKEGADYSENSPGLPISYTAMYLDDNSIARVSATSDYVIKTAKPDPRPAPLRSARVTWTTTGDGKDGDTQAVVNVSDRNGNLVAHIDCCSAGNHGADVWDNGRTETRALQIVNASTDQALEHGTFSAIRNPKGNDDWDYQVMVEMTFDDGTTMTQSASGRNNFGYHW